MKINTLEKLFVDQVASLKNGEERLLDLYADVPDALSHTELRELVRQELSLGQERLDRLEGILPEAGHPEIAQQGKLSEGTKGLVEEAHVFLERASESAIIDAGMVAIMQRIGHYMIARYGTVRSYAELLGRDAASLQQSLDDLKEMDHNLTQIALEIVNRDALAVS